MTIDATTIITMLQDEIGQGIADAQEIVTSEREVASEATVQGEMTPEIVIVRDEMIPLTQRNERETTVEKHLQNVTPQPCREM